MKETSCFVEELEEECERWGISPAELVEYVVESKNGIRSTRRAVLGVAGALGVGLAATGTAPGADTSEGIVTANKLTAETLAGPTGNVADLSSDILDLSGTGRLVLPLYAGTNPSVVVGDFYYDTTSD